MNYYIFPAAFVMAFLVTILFAVLLGSRGLVMFFFILFFAGLAAQFWIAPMGPNVWGISVLPLLVVAIIFSLLIVSVFAMVSPLPSHRTADSPLEFGFFVWALLIVLVAAVIAGYYRNADAIEVMKQPYVNG